MTFIWLCIIAGSMCTTMAVDASLAGAVAIGIAWSLVGILITAVIDQ